jgi:hypothetical protein
VGSADDTFSVTVAGNSGVVPTVDTQSVRVAAGASQTINLQLSVSNPATGISQGSVHLRGSRTDADTVVPYWFALSDQIPADIALLSAPDSGAAGSTQRIAFRVVDRNGVPLSALAPTVRVLGGSGSAQTVSFTDPNFVAAVRLGSGGANIYEIDAGSVSVQVIIQTQ